jgi:putative FmdB family regulatory protein
MDGHTYACEDCGVTFVELLPEIEDAPLVCPECGGLDIGLASEAPQAAA